MVGIFYKNARMTITTNNSALVLITSAAISVASPGTTKNVFKEKITKEPISTLIKNPTPAFLAQNRLDKGNTWVNSISPTNCLNSSLLIYSIRNK